MSAFCTGALLQMGLSLITWETVTGVSALARLLTLQPTIFITWYRNSSRLLLALKILKIYRCYFKLKMTSKHTLLAVEVNRIFLMQKYLFFFLKKHFLSPGRRKISTVYPQRMSDFSSISRSMKKITLDSQATLRMECCYQGDDF